MDDEKPRLGTTSKAILFMVLASLFFTALNTLVRSVNHLPTFQIVFFRSIGSAACCFIVLAYRRISPVGNAPRWLILRAVVGLTSMVLFFYAIKIMPLGSAVALRYLSPFFAAILAVVLLKEKMKSWQWFFFLTAFLGVLLIKGIDPRITVLGLLVVVLSALFSGMVYVIIRKLGDTENPIVIVCYFMTAGTLVGGIMSLFHWISPLRGEWVILSLMGLVGFIAQVLMTRALQLAEANLITPFKYSEVIFTLMIGWMLFGEHQEWLALVGISVIIVSLLGNLLVKRGSRQTHH